IIGPHIIDADGEVRTIEPLVEHRLTATVEHLYDPGRLVYFLTMEGLLIEVDVESLACEVLFDVRGELGMPEDAWPHFKGAHTAMGRVIVANNTYDEPEYLGRRAAGRLGEWDGEMWRLIEERPFMEVAGRRNLGQAVFATGWDEASAILKVLTGGRWRTYRLPKASQCYDHGWLTEWTRIREVETERFLMDCHGMFYELPAQAYGGDVLPMKPICQHLRIIPDFCTWMGLLVLGGNQCTPTGDSVLHQGQPQANLWLGKTDDLWSFGRPAGWGGPWRRTRVEAGEPSDPFLMTGFQRTCLHLSQLSAGPVEFTIEVDALGDGTFAAAEAVTVGGGEQRTHVFPEGFSAHWTRVVADRDCTATAQFVYT
ncbi:MAG: hypothetical protein U9R79_16995, partial [Armatimonadota bacterium]|nr:hypothetical protein [Armatimonadota bacterium]